MQLLKRDGDSDSTSGCSADMSNADSGKGGSDEGDKDRQRHPQVNQQRPNGRPGHEFNTIDKRRIAQLNGGTIGRNSPNKPSQNPNQNQGRAPVTYAVTNRNGRPGSPGTRLPSPPPPPPAPTPTGKHATTDSSGGLGNNTDCTSPLCTCPADTKQQCMDIKQPIGSHGAGTPYEGIHLRTFSPSGYHSPSSGTLRSTPNANNSNRNSSVCSEEGGSTTSGSYVVDGVSENTNTTTPVAPQPPGDPQQRAVDV